MTTNQTFDLIKPIGLKRLRGMEFLKTELTTLAKFGSLSSLNLMSKVLRKNLISTMIFMIEQYPFCSLSSLQAITVLDTLKEAFDQEDVLVLKKFVYKVIKNQSEFTF